MMRAAKPAEPQALDEVMGRKPLFSKASSWVYLVAWVGLCGLLVGLWGCGGARTKVSTDPWPELTANADLPWEDQVLALKNRILSDPDDPRWPHTLGTLHASVDSMHHAEGYWLKALSVDPGYAPSLSRLTHMYYEAGRHDDAIFHLEAARTVYAEKNRQFPGELLGALALHYDARGDVEQLPGMASELITTSAPSTNSAAASVGPYLLLRSDDYRSARAPAERAMVDHPGSAVHYNNFGITRLQAADPLEARKAFLNANRLDPTLPGPLYNLALVEKFYFMNDETAKQWFDRYWMLSQNDPDELYPEFYGEPEIEPVEETVEETGDEATKATAATGQ